MFFLHFLTIPGTGHQYPFTTLFLLCGIYKCMTGIFSEFIIRYYIRDFLIIDILPSSFHALPEFSFCDNLCVFCVLISRTVLDHNICEIFFIDILLYLRILLFEHFPYQVVWYVNVIGMHTHLPIL